MLRLPPSIPTIVFLLAGGGPARAQTALYRLDGAAPDDGYGTAVAVLGDVDGDGADDFAVGSPGSDLAGADAGTVQVVSGRTGSALYAVHGAAAGDRFGHSIAAVGDVDGDLVPDWIAGAPQIAFQPGTLEAGFQLGTKTGPGWARVCSGASGATIHVLAGPAGGFASGLAVAGGGDVDLDGIDDVIVAGSVARVYGGSTGALIREHTSGFRQAYSAAILENVDGNGGDDYAIGWFDHADVNDNGRVRVYRGTSGGILWQEDHGIGGAEYGFSVLRAGDLDGDSITDVVVGAIEDGSWLVSGRGRIRALSGVDGAPIFMDLGASNRGGLGVDLAALGDLDGDGVLEFAASQPGLGTCCVPEGEPVWVYSGASDQVVVEVHPDDVSDRFGSSIDAGDLNGDGLMEILVGARWDDDGGSDAGSVTAFTLLLGPTVYCDAQVNSQGCTPGISSTGTPSLASGGFTVDATSVLNRKNGLLFWGARPKQTPFLGGSLCVAAPTRRTPLQNSGGNPPPEDCSGSFSFTWTSAYLAALGIVVGDDVYCQYWSRDAQSASTTNLTDALAFTIVP